MKCTLFLLAFLSVQTTFAQNTNRAQKIDSSIIVDFPDVDARFPGELHSLDKWINDHIKYPEESLEKEEQGRVYVSFIVEWDGCITNIKIERSVSPLLDAESIRVIKTMPKWIPAEAKGKPVSSRVHLPFIFRTGCG